MAWVRLDDAYIYHPKFMLLSAGAFRLWHEGLCYCRKLMTDGLIQTDALKVFHYATPRAIHELTTPRGQSAALWLEVANGYQVHDYLDWNPTQAEEARTREATKLRVRAYRGRGKPLQEPPRNALGNGVRNGCSNGHVLGQGQGSTLERESERKPRDPVVPEVPANARSHRPIFIGQRVTVFEWMLDDLRQILGGYTDDFHLDEWFYALDAQAQRMNLVIPKRDKGVWLQTQLVAEAKRRGLKIAGESGENADEKSDYFSHVPHAWSCAKCGEVHEGTKAQAAAWVCLNAVKAGA